MAVSIDDRPEQVWASSPRPTTSTCSASRRLLATCSCRRTRAQAPHIELTPGLHGRNRLREEFSQTLFVFLCEVGVVLLITCAIVGGEP